RSKIGRQGRCERGADVTESCVPSGQLPFIHLLFTKHRSENPRLESEMHSPPGWPMRCPSGATERRDWQQATPETLRTVRTEIPVQVLAHLRTGSDAGVGPAAVSRVHPLR